MEDISLTKYDSNYHEIVVKLKGIDESQTFHGFMRGLDPNNEEYVEPK